MDGPDPLQGTGFSAIRRIGAGGMAEVFEAERGGRSFVVKVMHPELAGDPAMVDRMRIEGELLAKLRHPNLVEVYAFGCTAEARPFVAMERLQGRTVHEELDARGTLPPGEAIALALQLLAGLQALHRAGVVHRDLKPDNLFLCRGRDGSTCLKLLDLGVAKVLDGAQQAGLAPPEYRTREGAYVGTPSYAAPEQILGGAIDERTDVYGAALVLYELVAGHRPLGSAAADPHEAGADSAVPPALDAVLGRALSPRPGDRYGSVQQFAEALAALPRKPEGMGPGSFAAVVLSAAAVTACASAWLLLRWTE
jgi:serine/threonine-protein kinase